MKAAVLLLVAGLCLPAITVLAEGTEELRLDEAGAVARALVASPRLRRLGAEEQVAAAQQRAARSERWPQADVGAGYTRRSEVPELSIVAPTGETGKPVEVITIFPNIQDNYRLRAGALWPVYTGGRVRSQLEAARYGVEASKSDTEAAQADLVLEVRSAYWRLVTAREARRVLDDAIRSLEGHLQDARNREALGMAARNEVLAVEVERDRAELESLRAGADAELAEVRLLTLLDLSPSNHIVPVEPLETAERQGENVEALVSEALASRPERTALINRAKVAEAQVGVEKSARLPQVALSANYVYSNPNRELVPPEALWKDTWDAGVSVSLSVFDGGRRSASVARAQSKAESTRQLVGEIDRALRVEVTQRALELRTSSARLHVAERGLESARESRRVAAERYREGVAPSSELLDAETALERAALARTEALAGLRLAKAGLDRAVGRR